MSTPADNTPLAQALAEANRHLQQGDLLGAEQRLQQALQSQPGSAAAHRAMAQLLARGGRTPQALDHMQHATTLEPGSAALRCEYGCLLAHVGQWEPALQQFRDTVALEPTLADGWYFLGITLGRVGRDHEALPALRRARELAPSQTRTLDALAQVEFRAGYPEDALPLWQALAALRPQHEDTLLKLGETLSRVGEHARALAHFSDAARRHPESPGLGMALAQAEEDSGDREAAAAAYERALALRPDWALPLAGLLGLRRGQAAEKHVALARALLAAPGTSDQDRAQLGYALGRVFDARADYPQAMACWHDANAARRREAGEFDLPSLQGRVERTIALFDASLLANAPEGHPDTRPLFIVGMPRSGTTLTEQIIAAHPLAHGCGELPDIALAARHLPSRHGTPQQWPHIVEDLDPAALPAAAARYLAAASRHAPAEARRLVDKAPTNYYQLGLVAMMFPQARVVWCRRDPRDIAISTYGENFSPSERSATRLDGIGHAINLQERLMRHWQSVLPIPILELHYESLVSDPEAQARRLLEFAELPWDPACLAFHQSERGVQTPSRWQVRQPVHTRSVGRWRNYAFALEPLLAVLESRPAAD
jgi:tetratricopeptide (TPR) repeat protein